MIHLWQHGGSCIIWLADATIPTTTAANEHFLGIGKREMPTSKIPTITADCNFNIYGCEHAMIETEISTCDTVISWTTAATIPAIICEHCQGTEQFRNFSILSDDSKNYGAGNGHFLCIVQKKCPSSLNSNNYGRFTCNTWSCKYSLHNDSDGNSNTFGVAVDCD